MPENDIVLIEYDSRLSRRKEDLLNLGFEEKFLEDKRLTELSTLLVDTRAEMRKKNKTLADIRKQKQLSEKRELELKQKKELEQRQNIEKFREAQEMKFLMEKISLAEADAVPKTSYEPTPDEPELDSSPSIELEFSSDEYGRKCITRKKIR